MINDEVVENEGGAVPKRARLWAHQEGVYATFVSLPVPLTTELCGVQERAVAAAGKAWGTPVCKLPELHVSVTRTLPLPKQDRARLTQRVGAALLRSPVHAFGARLAGLECLVNEAGETSFVVMRLEAEELVELVELMDAELEAMGLPVFPQPAVLHVSLGWASGDHTGTAVPEEWHAAVLQDVEEVRLAECVLRVGDVDHSFSLPVGQ